MRFEAAGFLTRKVRIPKTATDEDVDVGEIVLQIGQVTEGPFVPGASQSKLKPVTVCEALSGRMKYKGRPRAVVGRLDCGSSLIDHVCFLSQDHCEKGVTTGGYTWPNKVLIVDYWEQGMPKPPVAIPEIDEGALAKTLSLVRKRRRSVYTRSQDSKPRIALLRYLTSLTWTTSGEWPMA